MRKTYFAPIAAGVLLAIAGGAQAATKTASFNVTATVANNCVISANPLALGTFDGTNDLAATSTVVVRCTNGTAYNVDLSTGASASYAARTMSNGTDHAGLQPVHGHHVQRTSGATARPALSASPAPARVSRADRNITVAGRLLASANTGPVDAGNYTDTIVASIVY